jgi:acyl carrier protein phosphodiesterase
MYFYSFYFEANSQFTIHVMNYLAHAYLSFHHPDILVGNMISDFVKGKQQFTYPAGIQKGIRLHRLIDRFTDEHGATKEAKELLRPAAGAYAGAFVDVVYDHFLAKDETIFPENSLLLFAESVYPVLQQHAEWLPEKFAHMLPYMQSQNWLYHYRFTEGIRNSFGGLVRRARYIDDAGPVYDQFISRYTALKTCYRSFFPDIARFATEQFEALQQ